MGTRKENKMNDLISINYNSEQPTVLGRDLHEALKIDSNYTTWFKRMCEYGFDEGKDFIPILEESTGGRPRKSMEQGRNVKSRCLFFFFW